ESASMLRPDGSPQDPVVITRSSRGSTVIIESVSQVSRPVRVEHKTRADGQSLEDVTYQDGKLTARLENLYDEGGTWIESRSYDADGKLASDSKILYDGSGRTVRWRVSDETHQVVNMRV